MSLNWSVESVKNADELCWLPAEPGQRDEDRKINPVTHSLIYATMAIDMGEITAKNCAEFFIRIDAWQRGVGPFMHMSTDKQPLCPELLAAAESAQHIIGIEGASGTGVGDSKYHDARTLLFSAIAKAKEARIVEVFITYDEVHAHIGLSTNVSTKSRAYFIRKLGDKLCEERERSFKHEQRKKAEVAMERQHGT